MSPHQAIAIRRRQILSQLMVAAWVATLTSACFNDSSVVSEVREVPPNDATADLPVDSVFYETIEQCTQDTSQKAQQYEVDALAFQQGRLATAPIQPPLKPEDCNAQLLLALQEHESHAPVYDSLEKCQVEKVDCVQATENGGTLTQGYYPRFGGVFLYPYNANPDFAYFYYGGRQHRVYRPTTVYRSSSGNQLITPYGRSLPRYPSGQKISVPQHTSFTPPARPKGTKASGAIQGRSSRGFGSTYKSTGRGGVGK